VTEPPARRRIVRERRHGVIVTGVILVAVAALAVLATFFLANSEHARIIDTAKAGGVVPFEESFDAEAGRHVVLLERPAVEIDVNRLVAGRVRCDIELSDGTVTSVGDDSQNGATTTDIGETIGTFDALAGTTTVRCSFQDDVATFGRYPLVVSEEPELGLLRSTTALIAAVVLGLLGAGLVWLGNRGRMRVIPADES
jgi:hypothetical protein